MMGNLYHYTSIETLYNMLEKSISVDCETNVRYLKMWATHIEYLNDETERKLFTDILLDNVHKYAYGLRRTLNEKQIEKLKRICYMDSYIISLSECDDDLGMWRGYGGNGIGVNIGFDFSKIQRFYETLASNCFKMEYVYNALQCIYFLPEEYKVDNALIDRIYHYLIGDENDDKIYIEGIKIIREVQNLATTSKHTAYCSEKEWRFVCECVKDDYKTKSIVDFVRRKFEPEFKIEIKTSKIPYRG